MTITMMVLSITTPKKKQKNHAQQCLDFYLTNDNHDFVDICWGEIKEAVHSNDAVLELKATNDMRCL